jgi:Single-strand binding protein family
MEGTAGGYGSSFGGRIVNVGSAIRREGARAGEVVRTFKTLAENIVESLAKGDRVFVHGARNADVWADKQTGEKRAAQRVCWPRWWGRAWAGPPRGSPRSLGPQPPTRHRTASVSTTPDQGDRMGEGVR